MPVHPCGRFLSSISLQNLHCLFVFYKGCFCCPLSNESKIIENGVHMQKLWGCEFAFGSTPERVRNLRPTGISGPVTRNLRSLISLPFCVCCGAPLYRGPEFPRRWTGVSGPPESPARGPGISGPHFSQPICICVVRLWIGVRSSPGGCPESPAWPESPAPRTGISGLPDDPAGRSLRSLTPESPAWTGSNG